MASDADTLSQLNSARDIVLRDHTLYPQVVPGIVQVVASGSSLALRRWGSDFLAETFASQVVTVKEKQKMAPVVLPTLRGYLGRKELVGEDEDANVVKSAVQCAASIYPFVFRHTADTPTDGDTWTQIAGIKSSILRRMDTTTPGVRICCIKFVASVVLTQTPGLIAESRRPEANEISLALVPRDHPIIPPANLEAEASGLLDRLLGVLQEDFSDALIVTATLNALASLVQRRASISTKIISTVLAFNPLQIASKPLDGKAKIAVRSMTRTTMSFLLNYLKRNANNTFAGRIQQQVERLKHTLTEVCSETNQLKRSAPDEPTDGLDDAKRQRLNAEASSGLTPLQQNQSQFRPLPPGPVTLADVFTLTNDAQSAQFHVERLQSSIITQLLPALVNALPQERIDEAVNVVRSRWQHLQTRPPASAIDAAKIVAGEDEDDDYDPLAAFDGGSEQVLNSLDQSATTGPTNDLAVKPFFLPPPPSLSDRERHEYSNTALLRVFGTLTDLDREAKPRNRTQVEPERGFNRLAAPIDATGHERDGWLALLTRLAARAPFDLHGSSSGTKHEKDDQTISKHSNARGLADNIREALFTYIMESFRARIDVAIMWLNEEWYSDGLLKTYRQSAGQPSDSDGLQNYWRFTLRLLDAMSPYLDTKDGRILIRFISELPAINREVLKRLKDVALDPERVQVSTNTLLYLVMFRPPAREMAIDCAEEMYKENSDAKTAAKKILVKWRPDVLKQDAAPAVKAEA